MMTQIAIDEDRFKNEVLLTFENEILGVFTSPYNTIAMTGISKSGASYPTASSDKIGMRDLEYKNDNAPGQQFE